MTVILKHATIVGHLINTHQYFDYYHTLVRLDLSTQTPNFLLICLLIALDGFQLLTYYFHDGFVKIRLDLKLPYGDFMLIHDKLNLINRFSKTILRNSGNLFIFLL